MNNTLCITLSDCDLPPDKLVISFLFPSLLFLVFIITLAFYLKRKIRENNVIVDIIIIGKEIVVEKNNNIKSVGSELNECVVCINKKPNIISYPCLHLALCYECCKNISFCPICRTDIDKYYINL